MSRATGQPAICWTNKESLGGEGDVDPALPAGYNFTDLELKLYESIVKDLISVLGGNPAKTAADNYTEEQYQALRDVLAYAKDEEKTEREFFVEGYKPGGI